MLSRQNHFDLMVSGKPCRRIIRGGRPYLDRYSLSLDRLTGRQEWLHHFHTADGDVALHNHAWQAYVEVLRGGYWAQYLTPDGFRLRRHATESPPFFISPNTWHRIVRVEPGTITRLYGLEYRRIDWYFLHPTGTVGPYPCPPVPVSSGEWLTVAGWELEKRRSEGPEWWANCPPVPGLLGANL